MKMKNYIWSAFFFLLASQAVNSQLRAGDLPVFDFSKKYSQQKFRLQDMADIEYVPDIIARSNLCHVKN